MSKRVVIGLSGGVDSSVAAYLLKEQGYDVLGIYMKNWHDTTGVIAGDCPWNDDVNFAGLVAKKLDIPFKIVDLSEQYKQRVVDYMFSEYEQGRTPNPDVLCNREIKFDIFLDVALQHDADFVATGHYTQKEEIEKDGVKYYRLIAGKDRNKDQSYFLCQLNQYQLEKALFPIGHLEKSEVRAIATQLKLATAQRKDSQGICFVGKVDLPTFLQQQLAVKKGRIVEIPTDFYDNRQKSDDLRVLAQDFEYKPSDGFAVGEHGGAHFFTIGQRKGLHVGGKAEPLFVIKTDVAENVVYVGQGKEHPGLYRPALFVKTDDIHWIRPDLAMAVGEERSYQVRIRYRQPLQNARLVRLGEGLYVVFDEMQRGITSGQFAAWYNDNELIGSGVIR